MKLKHATIAVLVAIAISTIFGIVAPLLPVEDVNMKLVSTLSTIIFLLRNISLLVFFFVLLKNQK